MAMKRTKSVFAVVHMNDFNYLAQGATLKLMFLWIVQ